MEHRAYLYSGSVIFVCFLYWPKGVSCTSDDDKPVYCMWKCSEAAAERIRLSDGAGQALCDDRAK